jgi:hypothetical protein
MRREAPAPAADKSVHTPPRDAEVLTIASNVLAVEQRAIPNGDRTMAALSARRTIGFVQKQPQAAVEPAPLLCKALQARSSSVSALSHWTNLSSQHCAGGETLA